MTQERFSTIEECREFAIQLSELTPKKKLEQKDNVVAMHLALTRHIDEIVNRVCTRHKLKCQWDLNYRLGEVVLGRGGRGEITLNPKALFHGAGYFRLLILHELAHLTQPDHRTDFWRTHILYLQEENLLPWGEIVEKPEINTDSKLLVHKLFLNGKLIVEWHQTGRDEYYCDYFCHHNIELVYKIRNKAKVARAKKAMEEIIKYTPNLKELAIKVRL